ncbi:MAG: AMP-binding protein [bacterium]
MAGGDNPMAHPEIERLEREEMLALQGQKLAALGHRLSGHPEWEAHCATAGLKPADLADPQALSAAPTMAKADLRERYPFPLLTVEMTAVERFCATSGTTGPPVMFGFTPTDLDVLLAGQMVRAMTAAGLRPGDRVYQGHGYGLWLGGLGMDVGLRALGATNFPLGPGRGEVAVEWLRDMAYTACIMSPLWLARLAAIAGERGINPKRDWHLRVGLFGGQAVSTAYRDEIEAAMPPGFLAQNLYGSTEAGGPCVAVSCPHSHDIDQMHLINEDTILTEVLQPETLRPVAPGEVGELVVTTLEKQASPVVRWRTGDLVRLKERPFDCPCGRRGLPLIGRIIGRSDDMLKIRGVIVYPSQVEDVVAGTPGAANDAWQIYLHQQGPALEEATVAIELSLSAPMDAATLEKTVAASLRDRLGLRVAVECHEPGTLPRYEGKAQRVLPYPGGD